MNTLLKTALASLSTVLALMPALASADVGTLGASGPLETAITFGYYISSAGFLVASMIMGLAVSKFGKSTLGAVLSFLFTGTAIFFAITVFQKLGGEFFGISDESMDIWWHIMFYLALISYYFGLKALVNLGNDNEKGMPPVSGRAWGIFSAIILVVIFLIPQSADSIVMAYNASILSDLGLHHFLAFLIAGIVGWYLFTAKKNLGQIGRAIAGPMIIGIWSLGLQHFWELLTESWKWIPVTSTVGEGVEKIFLTVTAVCVSYAAWRLKSSAQG